MPLMASPAHAVKLVRHIVEVILEGGAVPRPSPHTHAWHTRSSMSAAASSAAEESLHGICLGTGAVAPREHTVNIQCHGAVGTRCDWWALPQQTLPQQPKRQQRAGIVRIRCSPRDGAVCALLLGVVALGPHSLQMRSYL